MWSARSLSSSGISMSTRASTSPEKYAFSSAWSVVYSWHEIPSASLSSWRLILCALSAPARTPTFMPFQLDGSPALNLLP